MTAPVMNDAQRAQQQRDPQGHFLRGADPPERHLPPRCSYDKHMSICSRACPLAGGLRATPLPGLPAVDALASRWGVESHGNAGKIVWLDLLR